MDIFKMCETAKSLTLPVMDNTYIISLFRLLAHWFPYDYLSESHTFTLMGALPLAALNIWF